MVLPREQWLKMVRERPKPKDKGLRRDDVILMIDQSGPTTAFVKLKCQIPPRYFTDYLDLLKIDARWVVAQKVFATVNEAIAPPIAGDDTASRGCQGLGWLLLRGVGLQQQVLLRHVLQDQPAKRRVALQSPRRLRLRE